MWMIVARPQVRIGEHGCPGSIGWFYGRRKQLAQTSNAKKQTKKQTKTSDEDEQRAKLVMGHLLKAAISRDERFRAPTSCQNEAQAVRPPNLVGDPEQANA